MWFLTQIILNTFNLDFIEATDTLKINIPSPAKVTRSHYESISEDQIDIYDSSDEEFYEISTTSNKRKNEENSADNKQKPTKKSALELITENLDNSIEEIGEVEPSSTIPRTLFIRECNLLEKTERLGTSHLLYWMQGLKEKHKEIQGLENPANFYNPSYFPFYNTTFANIVLVNSNHWICVSNFNCIDNQVYIYDSLNIVSKKDEVVKISDLLLRMSLKETEDINTKTLNVTIKKVSQQRNLTDCGLYCLAFLTFICHKKDPSDYIIKGTEMRSFFNESIKKKSLAEFPNTPNFQKNSEKKSFLISKDAILC